ncbi:non-ribosomal peptide synthetase [Streptomyces ruber]|uniref:Non-ribosomal peptide synthetase n=2 Tax=Streptomyces TaxID=1883 RepID=A0A918BCS5_9ACTN|nr:non-ribosomal peptide synthetase [Streptomyces ruber]GGQ52538.1 non-ribosomal peptide synthetase [Streptomyces ruber]
MHVDDRTLAETTYAARESAPQPPPHPLTPYQKDIWAAEAQAPGSTQFLAVMHQRLNGPVDAGLLRASFAHVLRRHDTFRLRFGERDGVPFQWLAGSPGAERGDDAVDLVDLSSRADPRAAVRARVDHALAVPFETHGRPLFRAEVLVESGTVHHLLLKCHHLVVDGWAVDRLRNQVLEEYTARSRGESRTAAAPEPSPLDVADARAPYFGSPEYQEDLSFHRGALAGAEPSFFPRSSPSAGGHVGRHSFTLPGHLVERMKLDGGTPSAYLLAALGVYLARVHRTDHVVVGVPLLNRRTRAELAVAATYANTLPLRIDVPEDRTLADVARCVRESLGALQEHQRVPAGDVIRDFAAGGGRDRRLFDVTFSYMMLKQRVTPEGVEAEPPVHLAPPHDQEALALHVTGFPGTKDLTVELCHATGVFDADLPIGSVAGHLTELVTRGLAEPGRPARELPLLTPGERETLSDLGRGPRVPYAAGSTLHGLFEEQARRTPDRPAVLAADGTVLTYAGLDARAGRVARALRRRGVGPDDRVALLARRGPRLLVGLLGVLKAGGAYVPVDPAYPAERIAHMITDSGAGAVLADDGELDLARAAVPAQVPVLPVGDLSEGRSGPVPSEPAPSGPGEPAATARDLAYVIYTSGSTGRPKGVAVEHHSVVNRLAWMQRAYPIGPGDVVLQKTPATFDVSVWELLWWGQAGAAVALLEPDGEKDPLLILKCVAERGVTVLHFVPSMLGPFLDALEERPELLAGVRTLRYVFCSGEALPPARVEQFHRVLGTGTEQGGPPVLVNLYGPTEATVDVSVYECRVPEAGPVTRVPIGRPIDNIDLHVMDESGLRQPVGVPGELWIGGVGVARGYLGRPELTAAKFLADPDVPGGRLYRTGDLVRWLSDGNLEYLGRMDGQVKIRGNRVELGEVEDALRRLPGVRDAVAALRVRADGESFLAGYYVPDEGPGRGSAPDPRDLRERLAERLPQFMIPSRLVAVDRIPLGATGKADRKALPDPDDASGSAARDRTPPRTPTEAALAGIWADVLGTGPVFRHDDYYALGGDSLQMLRIRSLAERRGIHFALSDLVWHPTVAGLAARATGTVTTVAAPATDEPFALVPAVDRARLADAVDAFPLTRLQLGLVYHSRRHERSAVYHDVFRYRLAMEWDEDRFRRAFGRLVARHPALRSSFALGGFTEPLQIVHPTAAGGLETVDLRGTDEDAAEAVIGAHVEQRRFHRYDFERAPLYLFRAHVREDAVDLVLSFHHALLDGGSVAVLLRELLQDYLHPVDRTLEAVPDGPLPGAAQYVRREREALADPAAREHWAGVLSGTRALRLDGFAPAEPPRGEDRTTVHHGRIPDELAERVRDFARRHAVPVKSVLFAAYCRTLRAYTSLDGDLTVGLITHGRPETAGADRMTGLFLNTVPVRLPDPDGDGSGPTDRLGAVRDLFHQERSAQAHQRYPLSAMQEDRGGAPVLHTAFNYVHFHVLSEVLRSPAVRLDSFLTWEETDFQLLVNVFVDPVDGRMGLRVDGDGRTITPGQAELLTDTFLKVLDRIVTHPGEPPATDFLPAARIGGRPATGTARTEDVVTLFDRQAARRPEAVAVLAGSGGARRLWTYRQLSRAAARVAAQLLALGVRPGDRVGIAMDRGPETIAAVLGTAMSGAACVPLDTAYPVARIAAMLEQARPVRVIAHRAHAHLVPDPDLVVPAEPLFDTGTDTDTDTGTDAAVAAVPDGASAVRRPAPDPASTAYVLFTSGSTGRPKAVAMPHRSLANLIGWQIGQPSGAAGGTTAQYAPLSFDVSFQEIWSTLCSGGTLRLVPADDRRDMAALLRLLDEDAVERIFLPYVALQRLAEAYVTRGRAPRRLRVVVSSGEQLRVTDEIRRFLAALPGAILENQYGPTESHVVTRHTMTGDPAAFPAIAPIGTPVDGVGVHVLDPRRRPVPAGVRGELYISGAALADGYLDAPGPTAERFVTLDLPTGDGVRRLTAYRTGDVGWVLPDGTLVYGGRCDEQVKVGGHRVEPAEVELAVGRIAADDPAVAVTETAVVARERAHGETVLVAFLVGDPEGTDLGVLKERLHETLPSYMVPAHFEWLPRLPLTPSGKRDDRALRGTPLTHRATGARSAPRDATERQLADMAAELLGIDGIGTTDSLFDLGATSLTVMRLVARIEQRYGVGVPMAAFIAAPTVRDLAALLRTRGAAARFDPLVPIRATGTGRPLFLVHPMGGNVLCYLPLARHLPGDRPLYALQAPGGDAGTVPLESVPELAATYLRALRRVQPEGPYTLAGWSFGGFVVFEMARQLRAAGERADQVLLLDTTALGPDARRDAYTDEALVGWFFWELLLTGRGSDAPPVEIPAELATLDEKFAYIARIAAEAGVLPGDGGTALVRRMFHMYAAHWRATIAYQPKDTSLDVTLLRAGEPLPEVLVPMHSAGGTRHQDPANGWRSMTSGTVTVVPVPGDHLTLMEEPHVRDVARIVSSLISAPEGQ